MFNLPTTHKPTRRRPSAQKGTEAPLSEEQRLYDRSDVASSRRTPRNSRYAG